MTQEKRDKEIEEQARKDLEGITDVMLAWGVGYSAGHKEARRIFREENTRVVEAVDKLAEKLERAGYKKGG